MEHADDGGEAIRPVSSWTEQRDLSEAAGLDLRAAAAARSGVCPDAAAEALTAIAPLEAREYLRARRQHLSDEERTRLWQLRADLRSVGRVGQLPDVTSRFWQWLLTDDADERWGPSPRQNWLPADLARALAGQPHRRAEAVEAWFECAGVLGPDPAFRPAIDRLDRLLAEQAHTAGRAPARVSFEVATELALLSGMPTELVDRHRQSWQAERASILASFDAVDRAFLLDDDPHFRSSRTAPQPAARPRLAADSDTAQTHLVLAPAEMRQLDTVVLWRTLIELVEYLRRGWTPRPDIAFKKAIGLWTERQRGRRDEDGERSEARSTERAAAELTPVPVLTATRASASRAARRWLLTEIDQAGSLLASRCRRGAMGENITGPFPTDVYGKRLAHELGSTHVVAALNCLRALVASAAHARVQLDVSPARLFAEHMSRTDRARWGPTAAGRQARRGGLAAVACAAWACLNECDLEAAPTECRTQVETLWLDLRHFTAVAAVDGLTAFLARYRFTADVLSRPDGRVTEEWTTTTVASLTLMTDLCLAIGVPAFSDRHRHELEQHVGWVLRSLAAIPGSPDLARAAIAIERLERDLRAAS